MTRLLTGNIDTAALRKYLLFVSGIYWGLIFVCWLLYPEEHHYSIMTHTFSFLGSFESKHNPQWFWLFSTAMVFWGFACAVLVLYIHRQFVAISTWGAHVGAFLFLCGCTGIALVGIFPDARGEVIGTWEWTEIHEKVAVLGFSGYFLGGLWHGLLILKDRFTGNAFGSVAGFSYWRFFWPYALWLSVISVAAYFLISWEILYPQLRAAAEAEGRPFGSAWSEAMNTRYSFPLWENLVIYTQFIFLIWFGLVLPNRDSTGARRVLS